ncbi:MAG: glutaminyl-tRNA synthase (glutamine-hydrolyzing) subunit B [Candidatus Yanofskybacteria bacterium RIFOXYD1_FULL_42_10]|uniref:Aspartyl/glutamyl-tRNA(Asn/Gln) amidotransferase subunit B n=2 Tax=Candidatus Yanofskyibacteriota TaxID=1752733 RepID=A0A1F8HVQ9_9BACT|nr:MAG: glutaminyl-tRNA synthase (glutamine-hydrolyzing) subunit B [Candidatus Yanofskybacteria bacterium RIFOXYD1_FULL_42_10]
MENNYKYKPIIGLEIHAELNTKTKMFCDSINDPNEKHPNFNICPICISHPGTLPVINREAVEKVILAGLAMNCSIAEDSFFERKNYFYPDLPKGYQISQYQKPFCEKGQLALKGGKKINITRIHLEEDAGRLYHLPGKDYSLVDFNRAGVPLMELVTEPDFESGKEVKEFAEELQLILKYAGISDANMEKGQMRVEVNISLRDKQQETNNKYGTKVEIKNLNSIKTAMDAVDYEIKRQTKLLEASEKVKQETRGWDETKKATFSQRSKEEAHDYRYFPEPDLPPLKYDKTQIELIKAKLPELPQQRRERFKKYGLPDANIEIFTVAKHLGDYYEHVASELDAAAMDYHKKKGLRGDEPTEPHILSMKLHSLAANYIITEFPALLNMDSTKELDDIEGIKISPEAFAELMVLIFHKELSSTGAKAVLKEMAQTGLHPEQIMREKDMGQISNEGELETAIDEVIGENKQAVEDFKRGKEASLKFLIGKVMVKTKGRANPQIVEQLLKNKLGE